MELSPDTSSTIVAGVAGAESAAMTSAAGESVGDTDDTTTTGALAVDVAEPEDDAASSLVERLGTTEGVGDIQVTPEESRDTTGDWLGTPRKLGVDEDANVVEEEEDVLEEEATASFSLVLTEGVVEEEDEVEEVEDCVAAAAAAAARAALLTSLASAADVMRALPQTW